MKNTQSDNVRCMRYCRSNILLVVVVTVTALASCRKFVEVGPPPTEVTTATVFSDSAAAASAMIGLYSQMMSSNVFFMNGGLTILPALSSDELIRTSPNNVFDAFTANAISPGNTILQNNLWRAAYSYIYQCNAIIEGANGSTKLSSRFKQQLIAEARFNRAYCYFHLVNLFGDVPLVATTDYTINASMPRSQISLIYTAIDADLQFAKSNLSATGSGNVQPTSGAAVALHARLKLYQKDWAAAEANATEVINSGLYSLPANLNTVFLPASPETIWQLMPVQPSINTAEGNSFIPSSATSRPTYALTQSLINTFDTSDGRRTAWIKTVVLNGQAYAYPYKYKTGIRSSIGALADEYNIVLRLAEQYLIRSEARTMQGKLLEAKTDLNIIRHRAGLADVVASDGNGMLLAIENERRREFFAEWGHRWFDLKRTGRMNAVLGTAKPGWQPTDALYPIPDAEIQNNPALIQNPGY